ncbi:MAG: hypothetical protein HKL82_00410 [Acidimicrobiaceae bacterium]|nr:hypothetical protein [Acidimicrobiaceae bacterium]
MSSKSKINSSAKEALLAEKVDLEKKLEEIGYGASGLDYDVNFADSSQVTAERGEAEALANQMKEALVEVLAALAKLDDGSYGTCEVCHNPIGEARLEAIPTARLCMDCVASRSRR